MRQNYAHTLAASYIGYVVQALVINLLPLLFVSFSNEFNISVASLGVLVMLNFAIQLAVDLVAAKYVDRIGYRRGAVLAHFFAFAGLMLLGLLPFVMPPFIGIVISLVFMATGGGLTEVIISPIVQSLPLKNKAANMSLLHSFFSWGTVITVTLSTAFFALFGVHNWRYLAMLWSLIPLFNTFYFAFVRFAPDTEKQGEEKSARFATSPAFLVMMLIMVCGGASEMAMSQWASYFAETGLSISKTAGDLLGPCSFAILMGLARVFFAIFEKRINLTKALIISSTLCISSYLLASLSPYPSLSLAGCALCGLSVGLMWPGTLSFAAQRIGGGGRMFALLAFAGDIGCTAGPFLSGIVSDMTGDLKSGFLFVIIFPAIMLFALLKRR